MNKAIKLKAVIDEIGNLHQSLLDLYDALTSNQSFEVIDDQKEEAGPSPAVTLEQVRAVLAEKSRMGMTAAVRNLLSEYGVDKLSSLDPQHYAAILEKAEDLNNGA